MTDDGAKPVIVWFRDDLRLSDNPALMAAAESASPLLPVYILDDETPGNWRLGGAARWWLHNSLAALGKDIARTGARLVLRRGQATTAIQSLVRETGARAVFWNRRYEPFATAQDDTLSRELQRAGVEVRTFCASVLFEPGSLHTREGKSFRVYGAFWRACLEAGVSDLPLAAPRKLCTGPAVSSDELDSWHLRPERPNWARGFEAQWAPGEQEARQRLTKFIDQCIGEYARHRDRPDLASTSQLSPHLRFGEISPRQVWHAVLAAHSAGLVPRPAADKFLSELGWREFAYHLLYHHAALPDEPLQAQFARFPWQADPRHLAAWQQGRTGYPIVDAGMRELWTTGWMHNRVRMIVASFLVKHLLVRWQEGESWFWDTLVDADLANNAVNWQWVAGCGADAAPYFWIFNPVLQGEKFDPDGRYVRRWLPAIAALPDSYIHKPWTAPEAVRLAAAVTLDKHYPAPIVDHAMARRRALDAFARLKTRQQVDETGD
jgi:deoxyribodipyrimidine photo-lyase